MAESYVERRPVSALAGVVRTVWIHRTDDAEYVQRHVPTGGVEIHVPLGGSPAMLGPLTGPKVEVIPPYTTVVGVRFHPGSAPPIPTALDDLLDERPALEDIWGHDATRLAATMADASSPEVALDVLQRHLVAEFQRAGRGDRLVAAAARLLMPWTSSDVAAVADHLGLSTSQLRRRCRHSVGLGPKALQRTLRFQGFLALVQAGGRPSGLYGLNGIAALAADVGYTDQAHLGRECVRLAGLTPHEIVGGTERCACGHDHAAAYRPYLARRAVATTSRLHDSFKNVAARSF